MGSHVTVFPTRPNLNHRRLRPRASDESPPTPTRSNLGPLTTTFEPPVQCRQAVLACQTCTSAWLAQSCFIADTVRDGGPIDDTACWPKATFYPRSAPLAGLGFYSPGLICPTGYTSACTAMFSSAPEATISVSAPYADGGFQFPLVAGETAVGCCPSGYTCAPYTEYGWQTCHMAATAVDFIDAATCSRALLSEFGSYGVPYTSGELTISSMDLWAPLIQLNWKKTDRPEERDQRLTTSSSLSSTSSPSLRIVTSTTHVPPTNAASTKKLSIPAVAGITVAIVLVFIFLISILAYFCIRRRYLLTRKPEPNPYAAHSGKIHSMSAFSTPIIPSELPVSPSELGTKEPPHELQSMKGPIYELGAGDGREKIVRVEGGQIKLDTEVARFGRGLGCEDALESPVDGSSPFRLKRGNTLPRRKKKVVVEDRGKGSDSRNSGHSDIAAAKRVDNTDRKEGS